METPTLERLMMDDALGALPPDTHALLAAYLEGRPEQARLVSFRDLAQTAQAAMADPAPHAAPAPKFTANPRVARRFAVAALTMAAMVLLSLSIHSTGRTTLAAKPAAPPPAPPAGVADFWSSQRLLAAALLARPAHPPVAWSWSELNTLKGNFR